MKVFSHIIICIFVSALPVCVHNFHFTKKIILLVQNLYEAIVNSGFVLVNFT